MINKQIALDLFNLKYPLIELHGINDQGYCTCYKGSLCSCSGKHPVNFGWQDKVIKSEDELKAILERRPNANFGVVTGNGLVVIDIDPRHGGLESLEKIKDKLPTPEMTVKTGGGGYHFYYRTETPTGNKVNVLPGIDIRGEGGFVVAPGSKHKSGNYYVIEEMKGDTYAE